MIIRHFYHVNATLAKNMNTPNKAPRFQEWQCMLSCTVGTCTCIHASVCLADHS